MWAGLNLAEMRVTAREHTIADGVDRVLDRWFLLFRLFLVHSRENVV
jgi:hypothetical protein